MTWAQYVATGSGSLAFRLDVGGLPTQFVGHSDMVVAASFGVQARTCGLKMRGQKIRERADIAHATLEVGGMRPQIVDVGNLPSSYLGRVGHPTETTWLAANASASDTTITVSSTTGFASSNGYIWIDSECISYTGVGATTFTGCTRGVFNTLAQAHYIADGASLRYPAVTNQPITLEGQRVRVYAYGELDSPTGDGTLIYTGVVSSDPRYDGTAWSIGVDSLMRLLGQRLGSAGSTSTTNRGIYYPANAPFGIQFTYYSGDTIGGGTYSSVSISFPTSVSDTAYFESNTTFCAYLNDKITADATLGSWLTKFRASPDGESGWHMDITTDSATARAAVCDIIIPGEFGWRRGIDGLAAVPVDRDTGEPVGTFATSSTYVQMSVDGLGVCPRFYFIGTWSPEIFPAYAAVFDAFPDGRIYTGGAVAPPSGTRAVALRAADGTSFYSPRPYSVTTGRIDIDVSDIRRAALGSATRATGYTYPLGVEYLVVHYDWGGVGDFISAITSAAATDVNLGAGPDLRTGDIDYSAFPGILTSGWPAFLTTCQFPGMPKHTLLEVISAECQAAGLYLRLDPTVGITTARIKRPVASEAAAFTIPNILAKSLPHYEHSAKGLINTVSIATGYDPAEDEHTGTTFFVRDVASFGRAPNGREVEIRRLIRPNMPAAAMTASDAVNVAGRIFGLYGAGYAEITVDVPLTFFSVAVGSIVSLTAPNVPSTDGTIGITARAGIVVGREHDLTAGVLTLSIVVADAASAGYAPAAQIATETNVSGNIWDVTLANTEAPTGTTSADWFAAGDAIRVWKLDDTTPATQTGDVTSVTSGTVRITLDGAATLGTGDWILEYDAASAWAANPDPPFLFLATSAGRVSLPTALPAWGFSP